MNNKPALSIIVPIYNSEKYIKECIISIIKQTFTDWELILVDDGSSDKSKEICISLAAEDNRIRFLSKLNGGASSARNMGLNNAIGDRIFFVDADDIIQPKYIESFMEYSEYDYVVGGFTKWGRDSHQKFMINLPEFYTTSNMNMRIIDCYASDSHINVCYHICGKMFRRQIIEKYKIRFDETIKLAEDTCFNIDYLNCCETLCLISNSDYYYREANVPGKYSMSYDSLIAHESRLSISLKHFVKRYSYSLNAIEEQIQVAFLNAVNEHIGLHKGTYSEYCCLKKNLNVVSLSKIYRINPKKRWFFTISYSIPSYLGYCLLRLGYKIFR